MKRALILANGKPPGKRIINKFKGAGYDILICADGGANSAYKLNLIPDYIIGDLDSIAQTTLEHFKDKSTIIKLKRQNDTDVEKCLKFASGKNIKDIILLGAMGGRLDHSICNLNIVLKYYGIMRIRLLYEKLLLAPCSGNVELESYRGEIISIYGFDRKTKITSSGLKYHLDNVSLPFGERESTSNVAVSKKVKLKISNGVMFVIRDVVPLSIL